MKRLFLYFAEALCCVALCCAVPVSCGGGDAQIPPPRVPKGVETIPIRKNPIPNLIPIPTPKGRSC